MMEDVRSKIQQSKRIAEEHNKKRADDGYMPGSVFGVFSKDGKIYSSCVGYGDIDKKKPLSEKSIFRVASMTKPILGVAFMQQAEKGNVDLDEPITKWLPEFSNMHVVDKTEGNTIKSVVPAEKIITPRMLLTHSSGLGCGDTYPMQASYIKKELSLRESVRAYSKSALAFQPGKSQQYSPIWGMDVLACIIEIVSGMEYDKYIEKNILTPLSMFDTTYSPNDEQLSRVVDLLTRTDDGFENYPIKRNVGFIDFDEGYISGGAGLFSTFEDYGRFVTMLLCDGVYDNKRILKKETIAEMSTPQLSLDTEGITPFFNWGLSMRVVSQRDKKTQPLTEGSYGWSGAFGTHFWIDKKNGFGGLYMMNLSNGLGFGEPASAEFEFDTMEAF